jgi:O-succinylhomoserine sulfhydrylase
MPKGVGGLLSFDLGKFESAVRFVEEQSEAYLAVHLGDGNSHLVTHPASTTHSKLSQEELERLKITPGLVRMSVSLGEVTGLINDFRRVLDTL